MHGIAHGLARFPYIGRDVSNIDDWRCERFMRDRKYKIEHDVPYIDFDFESLVAHFKSLR